MCQKALSRTLLTAALAAAALTSAARAANAPTRADAASLRQKVAGITAFSERPRRQVNRTTVTEDEVNAYLVYEARDQLPAGVVDPAISITGTGQVSGRAVVDLDAVRRQKNSRGLFDPLSYATGRLPVTAAGVLSTSNGVGRFELQSATLAGIPIPKNLLQEIVSQYSRTAENPAGISLDEPFPLPARIREIQTEAGRAVVIQ
jgi:hypothetical protein